MILWISSVPLPISLPGLCVIVNRSLSSGTVPLSPLSNLLSHYLLKTNPWPFSTPSNYHCISNCLFILTQVACWIRNYLLVCIYLIGILTVPQCWYNSQILHGCGMCNLTWPFPLSFHWKRPECPVFIPIYPVFTIAPLTIYCFVFIHLSISAAHPKNLYFSSP